MVKRHSRKGSRKGTRRHRRGTRRMRGGDNLAKEDEIFYFSSPEGPQRSNERQFESAKKRALQKWLIEKQQEIKARQDKNTGYFGFLKKGVKETGQIIQSWTPQGTVYKVIYREIDPLQRETPVPRISENTGNSGTIPQYRGTTPMLSINLGPRIPTIKSVEVPTYTNF